MCTFLGYTVEVFMAERWKLKWKEKHVEILASFFMQVSVFCRKCPIGNTSWAIQKPVLLRTSAASWIYDVTFFSSHTSDLGLWLPRMFSATCTDYLYVSHHMLMLFEGSLLCFVEMFYWGCLQNTQICDAAQMWRTADPWISYCTLALSVQRRVCVMGAESFWLLEWLKWKQHKESQ